MIGALTDGVGPGLGKVEVTAVGAGLGSTSLGAGAAGGLIVNPAITSRTSLAMGGGVSYLRLDGDLTWQAPHWMFQVRQRLEADLDGRSHFMALIGVGGASYPAGLHLGLVGAHDPGPFRVYATGSLQGSWYPTFAVFASVGVGATWNPPNSLVSLGIETTGMVGRDTGKDIDGEVWAPAPMDFGVISLYVRFRLPPAEGPRRYSSSSDNSSPSWRGR
jgi:hypothetical protein